MYILADVHPITGLAIYAGFLLVMIILAGYLILRGSKGTITDHFIGAGDDKRLQSI